MVLDKPPELDPPESSSFYPGDFNDIARVEEKSGGSLFSVNRAPKFMDRWEECGLLDMVAIGARFTWVWKMNGKVVIRERLDRVLINCHAQEKLPEAKTVNLPCLSSNHHPVLFHFSMTTPPCLSKISHSDIKRLR
ncbi:Uncharacterized protein TCM_027378 [Theobroma cacao]|uniref:DNAse I-like superfamily protein n=1 Tax=Theobroma cacao TaxID=3641 RepID=A0A061G7Y2_THECC|nr:Uncharacterized protein TCM_027378 [Theobroma cacao]